MKDMNGISTERRRPVASVKGEIVAEILSLVVAVQNLTLTTGKRRQFLSRGSMCSVSGSLKQFADTKSTFSASQGYSFPRIVQSICNTVSVSVVVGTKKKLRRVSSVGSQYF